MRKDSFNRGFTVVELMAVIIVICLIVFILVPSVVEDIYNSKLNTFKTSVINIEKTAMQECLSLKAIGEPIIEVYDLEAENISEIFDADSLPEKGIIKLNSECEVSLDIRTEDFCALKNFGEENSQFFRVVNGACEYN